jgi:hypothetical protein
MTNEDKLQEIVNYFKKNKEKLLVQDKPLETEYDLNGIGYFEIKTNIPNEIRYSILTNHSGENIVKINNNGTTKLKDCNQEQLEMLNLAYNAFISKDEVDIKHEVELPSNINLSISREDKIKEMVKYFEENKKTLLVNDKILETEYDFNGIGYINIKKNLKNEIRHSVLENYNGDTIVRINNDGSTNLKDCKKEQLEMLDLAYKSFVEEKHSMELIKKSSKNINKNRIR